MSSIIYNNINITLREDGFISATQMCKSGRKKFNDWYRLLSTQELIKSVEEEYKIKIIDIKVGGNHSGTWIHPDLAVPLAQWISPLFSAKVSKWIGEWRLYNEENNKKFIKEISNLVPSKIIQMERKIQNELKSEFSAEIEVETPAGFIDVLTRDTIIEIKEFSCWKHAMGQILCYSEFFQDKRKCIYLFGNINHDKVSTIRNIYSKFDIELILRY
jgi:hypothetical protein